MRETAGDIQGALAETSLLALTQLHARGRGIVHLDGIEGLAHLRVLDLSVNQIRDLRPLALLTELELLDLEGNQVSDLSPLRPLARLERLMLAMNQVQDIAPLTGMAGLLSVDLRGNALERSSAAGVLYRLANSGVQVSTDLVLEENAPGPIGMRWEPLGPPLPSRPLHVGAVAAPPGDPHRLYAAAGGNGIWVSRDGGTDWQISGLFSGHVLDIATDPGGPDVVYASIAFGAGLLRSRDGGRTWERLHLGHAGRLLGADANVSGRVYAERRDAAGWVCCEGRPTEVSVTVSVSQDYGETWGSSVLQWTQPIAGFQDWPYLFAWSHPADPRRVWAGSYADNGGRRRLTTTFVSEDGGRTFAPRTVGRELADLVPDPAHTHALYGLDGRAMWRSSDDGQTWRLACALPSPGLGRLVVHPRFTGSMWVWGTAAAEWWRSEDGGGTWSRSPQPAGSLLASENGRLCWGAVDPVHVYAAAGVSGVARSTDGGASWDVVPLRARSAGVLSLAAETDGALYAAVYPGELLVGRYLPARVARKPELGGEMLKVRRGPFEAWLDLDYAENVGSVDYWSCLSADPRHSGVAFGYAFLSGWWRSSDCGESWASVPMSRQRNRYGPCERVAPSPEGADVVYARDPADGSLYRSADRGVTWQSTAAAVAHFAVHPRRSGTVFAARAGGPVRATADTGRTWSALGGCPSGETVLRLAVHPRRPDHVFMACSSGLYTLDLLAGDRNALLTAEPAWPDADITFDADDATDLCVLANGALWDTDDGGRTWRVLNDGPGAPTHIDALAVDPSDGRVLLVGTPTGVYRLQRPAPATAITEGAAPPLPAAVRLMPAYPNPFNGRTVIRYWLPRPAPVEMAVHDVLGQRLATLVDGMRPAGDHAITWDGRDGQGRPVGSGVYVCRLVAGGSRAVSRFVLAR
ncbi:MAG: leucine-rich repeat domain-containing protein [Candidatus Latescibacterota bacterium]